MRHPDIIAPAATVSVSSEQVLNALPPVTKTFLEGMIKQIDSPIEADTRAAEFDLISDMFARMVDRFPLPYAKVFDFPELGKITPRVKQGFLSAAKTLCPALGDSAESHANLRNETESVSDQYAAMAHLLRNHAERLRKDQDVAAMPSRG